MKPIVNTVTKAIELNAEEYWSVMFRDYGYGNGFSIDAYMGTHKEYKDRFIIEDCLKNGAKYVTAMREICGGQ